MSSAPTGVAHFYYAKQLPANAVGIAAISAKEVKPSDLVSINATPLTGLAGPAALSVTPFPSGTAVNLLNFNAVGLLTGHTTWLLSNQFFELTNVSDGAGNVFFYEHPFAYSNVSSPQLVDFSGNLISTPTIVSGNTLFHSLDGAPYWVRYYSNGQVRQDLLRYDPTMSRATLTASTLSAAQYQLTTGGFLTLPSSSASYWIRFYQANGYQLLSPYNVPLNDPWYPRIRFSLSAIAKDWGNMPFSPLAPYMQATWVPGAVLSSNVIEFERKHVYFDGKTYPDVLIYDKSYNLKYALDGTPPNSRVEKGYLYPWKRSQFVGMDALHARVHVAVSLEADDICLGFYNYAERDVVFTSLDLNPYVNAALRNKIVEFYYADRSNDVPPLNSSTLNPPPVGS